MAQINSLLFTLSSGMLVPVIILLLLFFLLSIVQIGSFISHFVYRRKNKLRLKEIDTLLRSEESSAKKVAAVLPPEELLAGFLKNLCENVENRIGAEKIIADYEVAAEKVCERPKLLMKIGPMLGLMGTLIPMGPALGGLASGDLASMSHNMQVAFATTVVGVFAGAVGYVIHTVRRRWFAEELNTLNFAADQLCGGSL